MLKTTKHAETKQFLHMENYKETDNSWENITQRIGTGNRPPSLIFRLHPSSHTDKGETWKGNVQSNVKSAAKEGASTNLIILFADYRSNIQTSPDTQEWTKTTTTAAAGKENPTGGGLP